MKITHSHDKINLVGLQNQLRKAHKNDDCSKRYMFHNIDHEKYILATIEYDYEDCKWSLVCYSYVLTSETIYECFQVN